jgi:hypothetical protein
MDVRISNAWYYRAIILSTLTFLVTACGGGGGDDAPPPPPPTPQVDVPLVVNQTQVSAEAEISAAGLSVGTVTTTASCEVANGSVLSQTPEVCTACATANDPINLTVSSGPELLDIESNGDFTTASNITMDADFSCASGSVDPSTDLTDIFTFLLDTESSVDLFLSGSNVTPEDEIDLSLFDASQVLIASSAHAGSLEEILLTLTPGVYYARVDVTTAPGNSPYFLDIILNPPGIDKEPNNDFASATVLVPDDITRSVVIEGSLDPLTDTADFFSLNLASRTVVDLFLLDINDRDDLDLSLFDMSQTAIATSTDPGTIEDILATVDPGMYFIGVNFGADPGNSHAPYIMDILLDDAP